MSGSGILGCRLMCCYSRTVWNGTFPPDCCGSRSRKTGGSRLILLSRRRISTILFHLSICGLNSVLEMSLREAGRGVHIPTSPSIAAQSISQVVSTWPPSFDELSETARTIAKIMVIIPTAKMRQRPTFSMADIRKFHKSRIGMAITVKC
jgi:hypothetical protein